MTRMECENVNCVISHNPSNDLILIVNKFRIKSEEEILVPKLSFDFWAKSMFIFEFLFYLFCIYLVRVVT